MGTVLNMQVEEKTDEGSAQGIHQEATLSCILCTADMAVAVSCNCIEQSLDSKDWFMCSMLLSHMLYSRQDAFQRAILEFISRHEERAIGACADLFPNFKML